MKTPRPYVEAVLESIAAIESYRPDTEQDFLVDQKTQDAVLMRLQDIGENLTRIRREFPDFWDTHAAEDWQQAVGLRNVISHDYGSIRLDLIWVVVNRDLGSLADSLRSSIQ